MSREINAFPSGDNTNNYTDDDIHNTAVTTVVLLRSGSCHMPLLKMQTLLLNLQKKMTSVEEGMGGSPTHNRGNFAAE